MRNSSKTNGDRPMIEAVNLAQVASLVSKNTAEHLKVVCAADGSVSAISWLYQTADVGLREFVKRRGGVWDSDAGGWTFTKRGKVQEMLDLIKKRNPNWPVIGHPDQPFMPLVGVSISHLKLTGETDACLVPAPLPAFTKTEGKATAFQLTIKDKENLGLVIGTPDEIRAFIASMISQGAKLSGALSKGSKRLPAIASIKSKLNVKVTGWSVQVTCDLTNPLHYLLTPPQQYRWDAPYPFGQRVAVPWHGVIHTTRKGWPSIKDQILSGGLEYEGDDPDAALTVPVEFDVSPVAGWNSHAPNGHLLHAYQKEGVEFCASRGMRALIGDEMGVGKTAQAIASAEACGAPRIVVICPANARYVWDREIKGWGGKGTIQHITSQLDPLDLAARWHIVTYDLVATRSQTWRFKDDSETAAFKSKFPAMSKYIQRDKGMTYIVLESALDKTPSFDTNRLAAWKKLMRRLSGELIQQILNAGQLLAILDEAHRVKNKVAKRTKAIQTIAGSGAQILMLTGTPIRNNEHEAAALLGLLDSQAAEALNKTKGYNIQDIKDYLGYFMIRRTKAEVLPELPEMIRQRIDLEDLDPHWMGKYFDAMNYARESYEKARNEGKSEAKARKIMQGGIARARSALGVAKVLGGGVRDFILDVFENKGCCVVFCAHKGASDSLKVQLEEEKLRVAVVDGRTSQKKRAEIVAQFQNGELDVFIGGIKATGEAITLTRADTVVFVELDWVPAALMQAEARIHREGQRSCCQAFQLIARTKGGDDENLDAMIVDLLGKKMAIIGNLLGEDKANIIAKRSIEAELHDQLIERYSENEKSADFVQSQSSTLDADDSADSSVDIEASGVEKRKRERPREHKDKTSTSSNKR